MTTTFITLPTLAANGPGAAVDVSTFAATKTFVNAGSGYLFEPFVAIEISCDAGAAHWTPIYTFEGAPRDVTLDVVCHWMRAVVSNYRGGTAPKVDVGADFETAFFATLVALATSGNGTAVATSSLPLFKTVQVTSAFKGTLSIQISEDGVVDWSPQMSFSAPGQQTMGFTAAFMRAVRVGVPGVDPGLPLVDIAADNGPGGGGSGIVNHDDTISGDGSLLTPLGVVAPNQLDLTNGGGSSAPPGTPVYLSAAATFSKARANVAATARTLGITTGTIGAATSGVVQTGGLITLTTAQWDAIAGTVGGLSFNVPYYLDAATAGKLTATPPSAAGQVVQQVIVGVSPTQATIVIADPVVLGSGNNLIQLINDNGSSMIIGTPVYSDAAGGVNLGIANNTAKSTIVGLVADTSIASGASGNIAVGGVVIATTVQWDAVAGTVGGLAFNVPYYLHPTVAGKLTSVAPTTTGQEVVQVITALSTTMARIAIQPPILL